MTVRILTGDCRDVLATLPAESVHCVVTSPPYWGLRDYGTAKWEGGESACDHRRFNAYVFGLEGGKEAQDIGKLFKETCGKCGARRIDSQIGLEPSFTDYIETMRAVFAEVRRVLRKDGTLWLNLGDSYYSQRTHANGGAPTNTVHRGGSRDGTEGHARPNRAVPQPGLKPKDLVGIPWHVAFALQADGWYLRSDIIWSKPNPMPESATDRPTKAHEYLFLMSKSERYYYDQDAIAEPISIARLAQNPNGPMKAVGRNAKTFRGGGAYTNGQSRDNSSAAQRDSHGSVPNETGLRNRRTVWEIATAPFSEAHFATFPPALIKPCILAGCPKGGTVLDPFGGAGTTGLVADRHHRNAILIELNAKYANMARRRVRNEAGIFADVTGGLEMS